MYPDHATPPSGEFHPRKGDALVIVARYPEPGAVKTRLGAVIGHQRAAELYRAFLTDLSARFSAAARASHYQLCWACTGGQEAMASVLDPGASIFPQRGGDFAERLFFIVEDMRRAGFRRLIISSSDSPQLPATAIQQAFTRLDCHDVVLGPAEDGGYNFVGLHLDGKPPDLFRGIQMSTPKVLGQTVERATSLGLTVALLEPLFDVDEVEDLRRLHEFLRDRDTLLAPHTLAVLRHICAALRASAPMSDVASP